MCVVAIDFDGVITADFEKARHYIGELKKRGHTIVIWSTRNNPLQHGTNRDRLMNEMVALLKRHKIPYDIIDDGKVGKYYAQVYIDDNIDDKAIRFSSADDREWIISQIF